MRIVFIRHATAEPKGEESHGQKLTAKGTRQAKTLAQAMAVLGLHPERVMTSPLLHAAETAAIIAHELGIGQIEELPSLLPPGDERRLRQRIAELMDDEVDVVAMVGHAPAMDEMIADIIADTRRVGLALTRGGMALVELPVEDAPNGAVLHWMLDHEQVAAVAAQREPAHKT